MRLSRRKFTSLVGLTACGNMSVLAYAAVARRKLVQYSQGEPVKGGAKAVLISLR
jgi:hypothetical protein